MVVMFEPPLSERLAATKHCEGFAIMERTLWRKRPTRVVRAGDYVQMPIIEAFKDAASYYATLAHELTHWTRHEIRLNRDLGRKRFGDEGYAFEELVAELGSAFLSADLDLTPEVRDDHAAYIGLWIRVLKNDKRAIFIAASHAQRAAASLCGLQKPAEASKAA